jgi:hypothetical protein
MIEEIQKLLRLCERGVITEHEMSMMIIETAAKGLALRAASDTAAAVDTAVSYTQNLMMRG